MRTADPEVYWETGEDLFCQNQSDQPGKTHHSEINRTWEGDSIAATIVALVEDLFFLAKIRETAKAVGVTVVTNDGRRGSAAIAEAQPQAIILDLNSRGLSALEWIRALKSDPATSPIRIVGFVSHVQEELISAARAAGCDSVMARSAFTQQLPDLLRSLATHCDKRI
jgi:CheY-like chemotaxis protein